MSSVLCQRQVNVLHRSWRPVLQKDKYSAQTSVFSMTNDKCSAQFLVFSTTERCVLHETWCSL